MAKNDLRAGLQDAARLYGAAEPRPEAERALRQQLEAPRDRPRWRRAAGLALAAAVVAAIAFIPWRARPSLGPFELSSASPDFQAGVTADGTPRVLRGEVTLALAKRAPGERPARVAVSHGVIEVMGTRFTVLQGAVGGSVTLYEGSIRFTADDGRVRTLSGTGRLEWPLPPEPEAPPLPGPEEREEAPPPPPQPKPAPALRADELLERVDGLRSRRAYAQAARELEAALRQPYPAATRERLSYELGTILGHSLQDTAKACTHWREHLERFPAGRYSDEVREEQRRLRCGGPP